MKWFIVRGPLRSPVVVEQDDIGEDAEHIMFACTCAEPCAENVHRVHKAHIGSQYFRTRSEAESRARRFLPVVLIEPSDEERSQWPDATRNYVEQLESFYDANDQVERTQRAKTGENE